MIWSTAEGLKSSWTVGWTDNSISSAPDQYRGAKKLWRRPSDEPMVHRMIALVNPLIFNTETERFSGPSHQHRMNCVSKFAMAIWRGRTLDELKLMKRGAPVHPTVYFSAAFSRWLVCCLELFIPLSPIIWGCWSELKSTGVQDTLEITSMSS
jgi:hypothetical protein